jgi:hypothetical protein
MIAMYFILPAGHPHTYLGARRISGSAVVRTEYTAVTLKIKKLQIRNT